jgi:hypothetical protein
MLYRIIYDDNTSFNGGTLEDSKWNYIDKRIKRIEYFLEKRMIVLENYESYNQLIERSFTIFGGKTPNLRHFYMMGRKGNKVQIIRYNVAKKQTIDYISDFGNEYNKKMIYNSQSKIIRWVDGQPSTGWKEGLINLEPHYFQN